MSSATPNSPTPPSESQQLGQIVRHELAEMQDHWWAFLILGIGWILLGTIALACTPFVTYVAVSVFGIIMVIGGIAQVISAFWAGKWSGFLLQMLLGIFYVIVGFIIMDHKAEVLTAITLLLAAFLMVSGLVRIVFSMSERFPGWGWSLLSGIVSLLLGLLIYRDLPVAAFVLIGLFIGIEMIFNGWYWVMLSIGLRNAPRVEGEEATEA